MEFCLKCDNMYYMKKNENNDLIYHCNFCGDENEDLLVKRNLKVYKYTKVTKAKDIHINEYTKFDPTLPHTMNIKCPNQSCPSNKDTDKLKQDVIYLRYDDNDMKYTYLCYHCNHNWEP